VRKLKAITTGSCGCRKSFAVSNHSYMTLAGTRCYFYSESAGMRNCAGSKALASRSFVYIKVLALRIDVWCSSFSALASGRQSETTTARTTARSNRCGRRRPRGRP
jgi:hypothetical protein